MRKVERTVDRHAAKVVVPVQFQDDLGDAAAAPRRVLGEDVMPSKEGESVRACVAALCLPELSVVTPCPQVGKVVVNQEEPVLEGLALEGPALYDEDTVGTENSRSLLYDGDAVGDENSSTRTNKSRCGRNVGSSCSSQQQVEATDET